MDDKGTERLNILDRIGALVKRSADQGFLGQMPVVDQIDHALGFAEAVERQTGGPPDSVLDLGTGGGIPGLVLAVRWPTCRIVLLDANERRTEFLRSELGDDDRFQQVEVVRSRAENAGHEVGYREAFQVVTSRSFGPPAVTAECGSSFLAVGGCLVVSEPPDSDPFVRWPATGIKDLSLELGQRVRFMERFGYQVLVKVGTTPVRYPRRVGVPTKRPIF